MTSFSQFWVTPTGSNPTPYLSSNTPNGLTASASSNSLGDLSSPSFFCQNCFCRKPVEIEEALISNLELWLKSKEQNSTDDNQGKQPGTGMDKKYVIFAEKEQFRKWLEKSHNTGNSSGLKSSKSWISSSSTNTSSVQGKLEEVFTTMSDWMEEIEIPLCVDCAHKMVKSLEKSSESQKRNLVDVDRVVQKHLQLFENQLSTTGSLDEKLIEVLIRFQISIIIRRKKKKNYY
jgi:hypothetical protein